MNTVGEACGTSGATWNQPNCAGGTPWAGGSVSATVSGVATVPATLEATVTWDSATAGSAGMLADVQSWIDSPASNRGWRIAGSTETAATGEAQRFYSREVAGKGPTLLVTAIAALGSSRPTAAARPQQRRRRGADGAVADSGTRPGTPSSGSGCSCSLGGSERRGAGVPLAGVLMAGLCAAARRSKWRSDCARRACRPAPVGSAEE